MLLRKEKMTLLILLIAFLPTGSTSLVPQQGENLDLNSTPESTVTSTPAGTLTAEKDPHQQQISGIPGRAEIQTAGRVMARSATPRCWQTHRSFGLSFAWVALRAITPKQIHAYRLQNFAAQEQGKKYSFSLKRSWAQVRTISS
jgi:hypothetical protein